MTIQAKDAHKPFDPISHLGRQSRHALCLTIASQTGHVVALAILDHITC